MSKFFERTKKQLVGDVAVGAIGGAKNGVFGNLLLAAGNHMVTVESLSTLAGACALGGALTIIPAMIAHNWLFANKNSDTSFLMKIATVGFRGGFAFISGCTGAAVLGLAIIPTGLTSLTASLTFSLLVLMTRMIGEAAAPALQSDTNKNAAMSIAY
ncbi:hypothetical protein [Legionella feeleii]|uniref:Transmembrane protein n=1 Tax=Legionella feeleii TaxID=453 RepID=A0A0W0TL56_9GAMM|nr:hypothetical protein [Legionella feeleii]KTC96232.1 hypothetical protein Lfee_2030 [Legionella feeleii]SPX61012.1 Uncharacterised protein [Legionella feeleii]